MTHTPMMPVPNSHGFSTRACVRNLQFQVAHSEQDAADNKPPAICPNPRRRCRALPCVAWDKMESREVHTYWLVKWSNRTWVIHPMRWFSQECHAQPLTTLGKEQEIIPDQAAHRHEISQQAMPLLCCFKRWWSTPKNTVIVRGHLPRCEWGMSSI